MKEFVFVESVASGHGPLSIETAKQCGFPIAFFTKDPAFYQVWGSADPLRGVDRVVVTDTSDAAAMMHHIQPAETAGVVALDDFHLIPASELAANLRLPHPAIPALHRARYKDQTRECLRQAGEHRPEFQVIGTGEAVAESSVGYPCVLKPTDGTGSVGVRICRNRNDIRQAWQEMQERWTTIRDYTLCRRWLIEEYVEGPEFSAELIADRRQWVLLGVTGKVTTAPPSAVEVGHVFPAKLPSNLFETVRRTVVGWLDRIGLDFGAAHIEFKLTESGPVLMEINPRLGGGMIPELIRLASGFDPLAHLLAIHGGLSGTANLSILRSRQAAAIRFLLADRAGTVHQICGRQTVLRHPRVSRCVLKAPPFETAGTASNYDRIGYVIATGKDAAEAEANVQQARDQLTIIYQ